MELKKDKKSDIPDAVLQGFIDDLVQVDKDLAMIAIAEAAGGDPKRLAEAEKKLAKAAEEYDKGHFDKAIDHYKKAWHDAQRAMKKVPDMDLAETPE
jgi:hypothetical protein